MTTPALPAGGQPSPSLIPLHVTGHRAPRDQARAWTHATLTAAAAATNATARFCPSLPCLQSACMVDGAACGPANEAPDSPSFDFAILDHLTYLAQKQNSTSDLRQGVRPRAQRTRTRTHDSAHRLVAPAKMGRVRAPVRAATPPELKLNLDTASTAQREAYAREVLQEVRPGPRGGQGAHDGHPTGRASRAYSTDAHFSCDRFI